MSTTKDTATALGRTGSALGRTGSALCVPPVGAALAVVDLAGGALQQATGAVAHVGVASVPWTIPLVELPPA